MRKFLLAAIGLTAILGGGPVRADDEEGAFSLRIENEYKLSVPKDQREAVWNYLQNRYRNAEDLQFGGAVKVSFGDERFYDRYFDDYKLSLYNSQQGVRHRTRYIFDDTSNRKHGRQLLQLKLNADTGDTVRNEIKFEVQKTDRPISKEDSHALLGLIHAAERGRVKDELKSVGIDATALRPMLDLEQRRRRVYISVDGKAFATITLDDVTSQKWAKTVAFTEIEMELNEIMYTEAGEDERKRMEAVQERMKSDLLTRFPAVKQDQTPKYNKAFALFEKEYWMFPVMVRLGFPLEAATGGVAVIGLLTGVMIFRRRKV